MICFAKKCPLIIRSGQWDGTLFYFSSSSFLDFFLAFQENPPTPIEVTARLIHPQILVGSPVFALLLVEVVPVDLLPVVPVLVVPLFVVAVVPVVPLLVVDVPVVVPLLVVLVFLFFHTILH